MDVYGRSLEYRSWEAMKRRCSKPEDRNYKNYGARGISVCRRWRGRGGFASFLADLGPKPTRSHTLERTDNDGDYTPENCRWATRSEQSRNRRNNKLITHNGQTLLLVEWAELLGVSRSLILARLRRGWSVDRALTEPKDAARSAQQKIKKREKARIKRHRLNGWTQARIAEDLGLSQSTVHYHLKRMGL